MDNQQHREQLLKLSELALLRLPQVLEVFPVCRSAFYNGIKQGTYPKPVRIGRTSAWRASDIQGLLESLGNAT